MECHWWVLKAARLVLKKKQCFSMAKVLQIGSVVLDSLDMATLGRETCGNLEGPYIFQTDFPLHYIVSLEINYW